MTMTAIGSDPEAHLGCGNAALGVLKPFVECQTRPWPRLPSCD